MRQPSLFDIKVEGEYDEISSIYQLGEAYRKVKGNKGAAGIDGVTLDMFGKNVEEELEKLSQELREWKYKPQKVKRVLIPKPGSEEKRELGIPTVRDRIVQESIRLSIEERFEAGFSKSSYGFRPGLGQQDAIREAEAIVRSGKNWVVDIDLEKFFNRINHDKVLQLVGEKVKDNRVIRLIGESLRSGVQTGEIMEGTMQGSPLSPLLSNIVLDELDKELEKRGLKFCRYADDCNIYVGSEKAGKRVMESIRKYIEKKLKLKINESKSKVGLAETVKFLGVTIYKGTVIIAKKSIKRAMEKIKEMTPRGTNKPFEKRIEQINRWYEGWYSYYRIANCEMQLKRLEGHIRRRLRSQLIGEQKRKRHLCSKLQKLGVSKKFSKSIYKYQGRWVLSHSSAVERGYSNKWFEKMGFRTKSNLNRKQWTPAYPM